MPILKNIGVLATCKAQGGQGELHLVQSAAIAWQGSTITWIGPQRDLPTQYGSDKQLDAGGKLVVPGLVDSHTHLAFAGWRADEFEQRIKGKSYLEIAKAGGGILSTVSKTRQASEEELLSRTTGFLKEMAALGVTTVECKSGYGLTLKDELKILTVYKRLGEIQPLTVVPTFMGAHTIPVEFKEDRSGYLKLLIDEMLPEVSAKRLAQFCDVFIENSAFTSEEGLKILEAGFKHNLLPRIHADQLSDCGGAALAAAVRATSASHLEHASNKGLKLMAENGVAAEVLPFASLYTRQKPFDARVAIDMGIRVTVATDFNPGSAPSCHLPFALTLACLTSYLTPSQALKGATIYAASILGQDGRRGSLEVGKEADLAVIDAPDVNSWLYHIRANQCCLTIKAGHKIYERVGNPLH